MEQRATRRLAAVMVACGLLGFASWLLCTAIFAREFGQDWLVFYTAARAVLEGDHALIWDGVRFTAVLNERFAAWLASPLTLHPWVYPPSFLLLVMPFGLLPAGGGLLLFLLLTYGGLMWAACRFAADEGQRRIYALTLLMCPAVAWTVFTGQNAFLTAALFVGGVALVDRRPWLGGMLLGFLTLKPQYFVLVPVALLAARNGRGLAGSAVGAGILALAGLAAFGPDDWRIWIGLVTGAGDSAAGWLAAGRLNGVSVFACATLLGASPALANLAQAAAIVVALGCVFWVFRQGARRELRLAALLTGAMLAAPHASVQDGVLLGLAAAAFLVVALEEGLAIGDAVLAVLVWGSPLFNPPSFIPIGLVTPALLVGFLVRVVVKASRERPPQAAPAVGDPSLA